jgi:phage shock protein A|tara:strand:- start:874 stop:1032 length:159 start_codon:yes stop_codon:yes gene_type:complete
MPQIQVERLRRDIKELEHYAKKLTRNGSTEKAQKILKKKAYIEEAIDNALTA